MLIVVGSTNPTKIRPVQEIFARHFKDIQVKGVSVASGVKDQPMSDDEMYEGAVNRAKAALVAIPDAEYGVGIEGGLHKYSYGWLERSMVVIANRAGDLGVGVTGGLVLPDAVMQKIHDGKNLEEAIDELFGTTKIGQGIGMFGIMTKEVVTRESGVEQGVAFALARFLHRDLYQQKV